MDFATTLTLPLQRSDSSSSMLMVVEGSERTGTSASIALYISVKQFIPYQTAQDGRQLNNVSLVLQSICKMSTYLVDVLHRLSEVVYIPLFHSLLDVFLNGMSCRPDQAVVWPDGQLEHFLRF